MLNYAKAHKIIEEVATDILSDTRLWHKPQRKKRIIPSDKLRDWYQAVLSLDNVLARVYLLLLLHTGMRTSETGVSDKPERKPLRWGDVDLDIGTLYLPDPKNHNPLTIPLPKTLIPHLRELYRITGDNEYLFYSEKAKTKLMSLPKKQINRVIEASGVQFSPHDLRRTFTTIAEAVRLPMTMIQRLTNHVTDGDVTSGYINTELETMRLATEEITAYILEKVNEGENVISLHQKG